MHELDKTSHTKDFEDIKKKLSTLSKLEIKNKVNKLERQDTKGLTEQFKGMLLADKRTELKQLFVPDHLLCLITGELMTDPVTLESGKTFEK